MAKRYFIDVDGITITVRNYCKILGLNYHTVTSYMKRHKELNAEQAIEQSMINKYTRHTKDSRLYRIWHGMMERCYNPKCSSYPRYGGRGIIVQDSWHNYFRFEDDMYDSYIQHCEEFSIEETTIEREDYDGNYCIENCTWETRKNQARNRRSNKKLDIDTNLMAECEQRNLPYQTILARINKLGWSVEKALNTPVDEIGYKYYAPTGEPMKKYCEEHGLDYTLILSRMHRGWSVEEAIAGKRESISSKISSRLGLLGEDSIAGFCREHNLNLNTVYSRLHLGWTLEEILNPSLRKNTNNTIFAPTGETLEELSERIGISKDTLRARYNRGWDWDKIMSTKVKNKVETPTGESIRQIAKRLGTSRETIRKRLADGWTWNEIFNAEYKQPKAHEIILSTGESLKDYCKRTNVCYVTIYSRITKHGWSEEKALNTPIRKRSKN